MPQTAGSAMKGSDAAEGSPLTFATEDKFEAVIEALTARGCVRSEDSLHCDLLWRNLREVDFTQCHGQRLVNHLKGSQHLSNKAYLAAFLHVSQRCSSSFPWTWTPAVHEASDLIQQLLLAPHTRSEAQGSLSILEKVAGLLPQKRREAVVDRIREGCREQEDQSAVWIVKPVGLSCGQGISVTRGLLETLKAVQELKGKCVVQEYLTRPLLLQEERKFDIRQWVLVTSLRPLVIFGFSQCYARLTSRRFSLQSSDPLVHLCNHAVQREAPEGSGEDGSRMLTQRGLEEEVSRLGFGENTFSVCLLPQIREIVQESLLAVVQQLSNPHGNGFEWLGFDFMVCHEEAAGEKHLRVKLLEINTSPDISFSTAVTAPLVRAAVKDLFVLLLDEEAISPLPPSHTIPRAKADLAREQEKGNLSTEGMKEEPRWCCWYAGDWQRPPPSLSDLKVKKNYSLQDADILSQAVDILCATIHDKGGGDDDEF
eukprot:scaffold4495_cov162-Ochromonas_danica.AAC.2